MCKVDKAREEEEGAYFEIKCRTQTQSLSAQDRFYEPQIYHRGNLVEGLCATPLPLNLAGARLMSTLKN